jgi:rhodanese-related sulfurtransferase
MRRPQLRLAPLSAAALVALAACAHRSGADPFTLVSIEETERMLTQPGVVVIDANTEDTFRKHRLPGAVFWKSAPLAQLLPAEKDRAVLFYCASPS